MRRLAFALAIVVVAACGKNPSTGDDDDTTGPDSGFTGDSYSLRWGPVAVDSGHENTQCIWVRLNNETEIKVHSMHDVLTMGSHHMIVYKDDMDTTEQATPVDCQPFTGALNTTGMIQPIVITQKADDQIYLPDHVAYTFAPHQMVKLEMHYINTSDSQEMVQGDVNFYSADPATIMNEAAILFTGSTDINLPPGPGSLHAFFKVPPSIDVTKLNIFAMTGHEHSLGTGVKVSVAPAKTGPFTEVYAPEPFLWGEPETTNYKPELTIPNGGGLDFTCTWNNTRNTNVTFGESATKEMCFFWAYYYPSQGSKVCIHSEQYHVDACCPGDSICSLIASQF